MNTETIVANDGETVVTIETHTDDAPTFNEVEIAETEAETEQTEIVADSAVEIARINADKEIQIAEIDAAVALGEAENNQEENDKWLTLTNMILTLSDQMQMLLTRMDLPTPPPLAPDLIPPSTPELTSETPMEVTPESAEEKRPEAEAPIKRKIRRL